jgi:small subunit ribosomal protein S20
VKPFGVNTLANIQSAKKRARQAVSRRAHNMALRSRMRTAIKKVEAGINAGDVEAAEAGYKEAVPVIDSMVNKGIVHANKAARHKSRLNVRIRGLKA